MGLYDNGPYGRLKGKRPKASNMGSRIASRIARVIFPRLANNVFDKLRDAQIKAHGTDWGMANDPRNYFKQQVNGNFETPIGTFNMQKMQQRIQSHSRSEVTAMLGSQLPNLIKRKPGIASSPQEQIEYATAGGTGAAAKPGNTVYVDDAGFPVTLQQILGSQLLSPAQLQSASIQNVQSLVRFDGGSSEQKQEALYMFQRMMLEGYIRGVDITKELKRQGGITYNFDNSAKSSVIGSTSGSHVSLGGNWWNSHSDADKYTLFLHETGHSLLDAHHENTPGLKTKTDNVMTAIYNGAVTRDYNRLMNGLFLNDNNASITKGNDIYHGAAVYDASWFPSLTGAPTPGYSPNGGSGDDGTVSTPQDNNGTNPSQFLSFLGPPSVSPNIEVTKPTGMTPNTGASRMAQPSQEKSPVVGPLSEDEKMSTQTFVAGLQKLQGSGQDSMQKAGALLNHG